MCEDFIAGSQAMPQEERCGGCGAVGRVRATVDGSGSCSGCAWTADAATISMARSKQLCEHGTKQEGIRRCTERLTHSVGAGPEMGTKRKLRGQRGTMDRGHRTAHVDSGHSGLTQRGTSAEDWEGSALQPTGSKQFTLQDVGVTGGHQTVGTGGKSRTGRMTTSSV